MAFGSGLYGHLHPSAGKGFSIKNVLEKKEGKGTPLKGKVAKGEVKKVKS